MSRLLHLLYRRPHANHPALLWTACLMACVPAFANEPAPPVPNVPVLELLFIDHPGTPQATESVAVQVLANGEVRPGPDAAAGAATGYRLNQQRLQNLLAEVLVRGQVANIDSATMERNVLRACEAAGLAPQIEGAAVTVIRWRTSDRSGEVRCNALSVMAARFPDLPEVQRLHDAQLRLQNVAAIAQAGGEDASEQLAEIANRELKATHPNAPRLTHRDLSMFRELSTGSRYVQFYRRSADNGELLVSVFQIPGQPARVSVTAQPN